jgi:uncharacterized protein YbbK (DUF523 family)
MAPSSSAGRRILISACLFGLQTTYLGKASSAWAAPLPDLLRKAMAEGYEFFPICPEQLGGLPTPRAPSEIQPGGKVLDCHNRDVTRQFQQGAKLTLDLAHTLSATVAILKARSPSCGRGQISNGTFSGTLIPGNGVTTTLLQANGIRVLNETEFVAMAGSPPRFDFLRK